MHRVPKFVVVAAAAAGIVSAGFVGGSLGRIPTYEVVRVVDGDTVVLDDSEIVRIAGIDTPERGQCGYQQARSYMESLVLNKTVGLSQAGKRQTDKYGRIIRYISVDGEDVGLKMIESSWAIARYDSRDGYGFHIKQTQYIQEDAKNVSPCGR
jgi:endonuclease YncB( thermonuclease family)